MADIRLFLALVPPAGFLDALEPLRNELSRSYAGLRLVPRPNVHVTVRFLGQVDDARLGHLVGSLHAVLSEAESASLTFDRLIGLPSASKARVIALEAACPPALAALVSSIEEGLAGLGFARETRAFRAHLTLARAKRSVRLPRERAAAFALGFEANEVVLFQSWLEARGARYEARARFALRGDHGPANVAPSADRNPLH